MPFWVKRVFNCQQLNKQTKNPKKDLRKNKFGCGVKVYFIVGIYYAYKVQIDSLKKRIDSSAFHRILSK